MKKRLAIWFDGIVSLGDDTRFQDVVAFSVVNEMINITHNQGGGAGEISWPAGRKVHGTIQFNAFNAAMMAVLTGGSLSTGTVSMVRRGTENHTITDNTVTLTEAGDVIEGTISLVGGAGTIFKKVAESPAAGEFSYVAATGVATFNAAETETTIYPEYLHADSANGQTLDIGVRDVPSELTLYGALRSKDLNAGTEDVVVAMLKNVNIGGNFEIGGESGGSTKEMSIDYSAVIAAEGDYKIYFPD